MALIEDAGGARRGEHQDVLQPLLRPSLLEQRPQHAARPLVHRRSTVVRSMSAGRGHRTLTFADPVRARRRRRAARGRRASRRRRPARRRSARRAAASSHCVQAAHLLRTATVRPVELAGEHDRRVAEASCVASTPSTPSSAAERLDVQLERRRHDHDRIACLHVGVQIWPACLGADPARGGPSSRSRRRSGLDRLRARRPANVARAASALNASRSRRDERPRPTSHRMGGDTGDERRRACHLPQERHHAVTSRSAFRRGRTRRLASCHVSRRAGIESSTSQNAGPALRHDGRGRRLRCRRPRGRAARTPSPAGGRGACRVVAPCSRSVGRMSSPSSSTITDRRRSWELGGEIAQPVALLARG